MTSPHRELAIIYGGLSVGGDAGPGARLLLHDYVHVSRDRLRSTIRFSFVVREDGEAAFADTCRLVERVFRTQDQDLIVRQGGHILVDARVSANAGFETEPRIVKEGDIADTGRSRLYRVEIEYGEPATNRSYSGLRDNTVDVSYAPSRRRIVRMAGTWTAAGTLSAREAYEANAPSWAAAVLAALGGTFELLEEPRTEQSRQDQTLVFTRIYEEIIYAQAGHASTDDPDLVHQVLSIRAVDENPGDSADTTESAQEIRDSLGDSSPEARAAGRKVQRLRRIELAWDAQVDKTATQDLYAKLDAVRPWLLAQIEAGFASASFALVAETREAFPDENRLAVRMTVLAPSDGQTIFERTFTTEDHDLKGKVLVPIWNGNEFARHIYQGPRTRRRTTTIVSKALVNLAENSDDDPSNDSNAGGNLPGGGGGWVAIESRITSRPFLLGYNGRELQAYETTTWSVRERADTGGVRGVGGDYGGIQSSGGTNTRAAGSTGSSGVPTQQFPPG